MWLPRTSRLLTTTACLFLVIFARQTQVNDGQHHENEGLQRQNQDVEHRPGKVQRQLEVADGCDQDEDKLTGVQVTEQT